MYNPEVAPCTRVQAFHCRFLEGVEKRELQAVFECEFRFRDGRRKDVGVTMFYSRTTDSVCDGERGTAAARRHPLRRPGERGDGFTGGEDLSGRDEFAGRENVTRERREHAADPGEPLEEEAGDRGGASR